MRPSTRPFARAVVMYSSLSVSMTDDRIRIEYWPMRPRRDRRPAAGRGGTEVGEVLERASRTSPRRGHAERREPVQRRGEDQQQDHAQQEVGHRVEDQREPVADEVDRPAASPAGVGAEAQTDDDRDQLTETEQQQRRAEPARDDLRHRAALGRERVPEIAASRRRDIRNELVGEEWLVDPPPLTDLLDGLRRDVRVSRQDPLRRAGHRPEEQEIDHDDHDDRDRRLQQAARHEPCGHASSSVRDRDR